MGTRRGQIQRRALELIAANPAGFRYTQLARRIQEDFPEVPINTIYGSVWNLDALFPAQVGKPARGVFQAVEFKEAGLDPVVAEDELQAAGPDADPVERLNRLAQNLCEAKGVPRFTVRALLGWFGAERRDYDTVQSIRLALRDAGLHTTPDLEETHIDGEMVFTLAGRDSGMPLAASRDTDQSADDSAPDIQTARKLDPTYRVGVLAAANHTPTSVSPNDSISQSITLMIKHDCSQLPVMSGRDVRGTITWRSIGLALGLGRPAREVRDCIDNAVVIQYDASLFSAIETIYRTDYALIRHADNRIGGIVTSADLTLEFRDLAEPFLLLSEIERSIRLLLSEEFTVLELEEARDGRDPSRSVGSPDDLTFGEYIRLLERPENWDRLGLQLERAIVIRWLNEVRGIRNEVMHFNPDPLTAEQLVMLREFTRMFQTLRRCGAV